MSSGLPRQWYGSARWKRRRAAQLMREPLCRMCMEAGIATPATVADHREAHRGEPELFWKGELDSLCASHHSRDKQIMERGGKPRAAIAADGWPI